MKTLRTHVMMRLAVGLVMMASRAAFAVEPAGDSIPRATDLAGSLMHIHFHLGWNGFEIRQRELAVPVGPFFGELPQAFAPGTTARAAAERAASIGVAQMTLTIIGLVGAGGGTVMALLGATRATGSYSASNTMISAGLIVLPASLLVVLAGALFGLWAQGFVSDAVASYNDGVLRDALRLRREFPGGPLPGEPAF